MFNAAQPAPHDWQAHAISECFHESIEPIWELCLKLSSSLGDDCS